MKKLLAMTMALMMVWSCTGSVFADSGSSKELEKAIVRAKSVVVIPADCTIFSSRSTESTVDGKLITQFQLEWENEAGTKAVSANVDQLGNFLAFRSYEERETTGLAKVSRSQAKQKADAFVKKALPEIAAAMKEVQEKETAGYASQHSFTYKYYLGSVPVAFMSVQLTVDKYTGEVTSFTGLDAGFTMPTFPAVSGVIEKQQADLAWQSELGLELQYGVRYEEKQKAYQVYLAYVPCKDVGYAIDAKTGKAVNLKQDVRPYGESGGAAEAMANDGVERKDAGLSQEELKKVEETADLIAKEQAEQAIRKEFSILESTDTLTNAVLICDIMDGNQYRWQLYFKNANGTVDANSGEILSFQYYNQKKTGGTISAENASSIATDFLQHMVPDTMKEVKLNETFGAAMVRNSGDDYNYRYERQVNGCTFPHDSVSVRVDGHSGQITSYQKNWLTSVTFPSISGVMPTDKAYEILDDSKQLQLTYDKTNEEDVRLVYEFQESVANLRMDPIHGFFLRYDGKKIEERGLRSYTDIKGHWSEPYVCALLENGYYLEGTQFKADEWMTQLDFFRYLYSVSDSDVDTEELYQRLLRDKMVLEGEKNPEGVLCRQDAAKFLVRFLSLQQAGEHPELFVNVFRDTVQEEYRGYATLCQGLGIFKGDSAGRFNGTSKMTRGEGATVIYQMNLIK